MGEESCKIEGCCAKVRYRNMGICQKHYFRMMRNGSFERKQKEAIDREHRKTTTGGYILLKYNGHPLAQKSGYVFEHRKVVYDIYGDSLPPCQLCGSKSDWSSRKTHIDHIDEDRANNSSDNLRVLCNPCNSRRGRKNSHEYPGVMAVTIDGVTKTANEWAKYGKANFCGASIKRRIMSGIDHKEAVFGRKLTHKNTTVLR